MKSSAVVITSVARRRHRVGEPTPPKVMVGIADDTLD
jgi:hypothetical protein